MSKMVLSERRDVVHWLIINRPVRRNALNRTVVEALRAGIEAAEADAEVRAIVLTGAGDKAFCAGGDMKESADGTPVELDAADPRNAVVALFRRMADCRLPIIARVNGHALAGGFGLMCACDLAVASSKARFGTPEVGLGLFPMMILPLMQRVMSRRRLMEICMTGEPISAEEALAMDLVNRIAPPEELDEALDKLVAQITSRSPTALRLGKMAFRAMQDMSLDQAFEYAQLMLPIMAQSDDAREGFRAFAEKRAPKWSGS